MDITENPDTAAGTARRMEEDSLNMNIAGKLSILTTSTLSTNTRMNTATRKVTALGEENGALQPWPQGQAWPVASS